MPWPGNIAKIVTSDGKHFTATREMFTTVARDQSLQLKVAWCCGWNVSAFFTSQPQPRYYACGITTPLWKGLCVEWTMMNNEPWIKLETLGNEWRNMSTWIDESSTSILKYCQARHFVKLLFNTKILQNILFMNRWLQTDTILSKNCGDQNTRNLQSLVITSIDFIMLPVIHFYKRLSRDALFSVQID